MTHYWFNAALKGILEGFTEFLPISSTGHLVLVRDWLPLTTDPARSAQLDNLFDIIVQLPAVMAIVILYWRTLLGSTSGLLTRPDARRFWLNIIAGFIPAGVIGFLVKNKLELLMQPGIVAVALIVGGVALIAMERLKTAGPISRTEQLSLKTSLGIGFFQCLSMIPGTSRSGATIVGGRLLGMDRRAAAEYSFFLALPTMLGAFTLKFAKEYSRIDWSTDGAILLIGSVFSFATAWIVVALFLRFIQKNSLSIFGWYRIILGSLILFLR